MTVYRQNGSDTFNWIKCPLTFRGSATTKKASLWYAQSRAVVVGRRRLESKHTYKKMLAGTRSGAHVIIKTI